MKRALPLEVNIIKRRCVESIENPLKRTTIFGSSKRTKILTYMDGVTDGKREAEDDFIKTSRIHINLEIDKAFQYVHEFYDEKFEELKSMYEKPDRIDWVV